MLMVVFGAGASYDSWPTRPARFEPLLPDRPPLADQLFDSRPEFMRAMALFPKCKAVIPYFQRPLADTPVELEMEKLRSEVEEYPERQCQLAAIRFYLQSMLWECEVRLKQQTMGITNYRTLLDEIEHWRGAEERVCLVSFNYDTLLEDALPAVGINILKLPDYVAAEYKIIKLHGSVNWAHEVETPLGDLRQRDAFDIANELINRVFYLDISQEFRMLSNYPIDRSTGTAQFPALAIPVATKQDYECPEEHLEILRACIPDMDKLMIIGWRATENQFLKLLHDNLGGKLRVMVVDGDKQSTTEVIERMRQAGIVAGEFLSASGGFSQFVSQREGDDFLRS